MLACFDDMLTCSEDSFESAFFDDQFTNVADEAALLDVDNFDLDSIFARSTSTEGILLIYMLLFSLLDVIIMLNVLQQTPHEGLWLLRSPPSQLQ